MTTGTKSISPTLFVGAGRMASAIVEGLLSSGSARKQDLSCTCGKDPTGPALAEKTGIRFVPDLTEGLPDANLILLACKPQQLADLPPTLASGTRGKLILSILAGIPLARLKEIFPEARNIVRVMPNTPAQIGKGVSAYASLKALEASDLEQVETLLRSMGKAVALDEAHMDAVTALSGSGPAYLFEFTRLLGEAGRNLGLPEEVAALLARQTVTGAAALLEKRSDAHPEDLVREVTSPGGTTEAALKALQPDFEPLLKNALTAARDRSRELSRI